MNTAEKIYETVKGLSETDACQVLDFAERLKAKGGEEDFFSMAGIWQDRDITVENLREVAWRENAK